MKKPSCAACAAVLLLGLFAGTTQASVVIGGTRVVFPAQDREVTVRLSNEGSSPALVEAWIDDGDPMSTPEKAATPFLITPPLFRMEAHKEQSLRIIVTNGRFPADRESLFWLNVLEIPPRPKAELAAGKNLLQFAIRSRLKLFYRPAGLRGDPLKAAERLNWKLVSDGQGLVLQVNDPTPYHVTISRVTLDVGGKQYAAATGMVAPFGELRLALGELKTAPAAATSVSFTTINDYGAADTHKGVVTP